MLPDARARAATGAMGSIPGMGVDSTTVTSVADSSETSEDEKVVKVANQQWAAHCLVNNMGKPVRRSKQVPGCRHACCKVVQ